jgi:hypothetical protein
LLKYAHRDYTCHRQAIEPIFTMFSHEWSRSSQCVIEAKAGIPHQRLYSWKQKWEPDPTCRPRNSQVDGWHHRVFTDATERAISDHISHNYLVPSRLFTDKSFVEIATMAFQEKIATRRRSQNSDVVLDSFPISENGITFHPTEPI